MEKSKPIITAMDANPEPRKLYERILDEKGASKYYSGIGNLSYIAMQARPDICVPESSLCEHVKRPCITNMWLQDKHCHAGNDLQIVR